MAERSNRQGGTRMKQLMHTIVVALAVAAIAAPAAVAGATLDPWQQNLNARTKYAHVTDPWALNLFARQSHRDRHFVASSSLGPTSTVTAGSDFGWAEFGIGAVSMLAVVLFAGFAAVAIQHTRRH